MFALFKKEISSFLHSLIGYIVICVFLTANGLILWAFPNSLNILEFGYATLDSLFILAPFVFLFLLPVYQYAQLCRRNKHRNYRAFNDKTTQRN